MKFIRSIERVTKMDKIRSKVLREKVGVESLSFKIGKERLKYYGRIMRMKENRLPKQALEMKYEKRGPGRPRERWVDQVRRDVEVRGEKWDEVNSKEAWWMNKERWNELLHREEEEGEDGKLK